MPSGLYVQLDANITQLTLQFRDFARVDASQPSNQIKLRALVSLIHAEFETYFEQLGFFVIANYQNNSLSRKQKAKINYSIICYGTKLYEGAYETVASRISGNIVHLRGIIANNNGIKEKDILKILLPLSFPVAQINQTWMNTINSFGSLRGDLIHNSLNQITRLIGYDYFDVVIGNIIMPGILGVDNYYVSNFSMP